jgi:hypothetical protein
MSGLGDELNSRKRRRRSSERTTTRRIERNFDWNNIDRGE